MLLVDDEENILSALTRLLRRDGYQILRGNSGKAGLDLLKDNAVGVIISDQRMPEMTGVEFLGKVKELYPDTVRIVLSGYTELKSVTDAINEGAIFKFLTKPWDDELLRAHVRDAFAHFELKHENERLTQELRTANTQLAQINDTLAHRVEQKTQDAVFSLSVLQIAQDVMEYLPMAVIGIAKDGMVIVANRLAQQWLTASAFIGQQIETVISAEILDVYQQAVASGTAQAKKTTSPTAQGLIHIQCVPLGNSIKPRGWIIVMSAAEDSP